MVGVGAITDTTSTVGGIDQSSYSWWEGIDNNNSGVNRDLTWQILNSVYYDTKKYGEGDKPTLVVLSEGAMENFENWLTTTPTDKTPPVQRQMLVGDGKRRKIDGGFDSLSFKGIPIVSDPYCTANTGFVLNEKYLHWRVLKDFNTTGWTQQRVNGDDWVQNVIFGYGALTSSANRKQAMIDDLTEV